MSTVRARDLALTTPAALFLAVFMIAPLLLMLYVSTLERAPFGGVLWGSHTGVAYEKLLFERDLAGRLSFNSDYIAIFARSFRLATITTILTLLVSLPTALYMTTLSRRRAAFILFLVTVPFWTNLLVRNFAWILILRNGGTLDQSLQWLGLTSNSLDILYTPLATGIGLTYSFLPFMILPTYVALERIDKRLIEAAFDLGADRWRVLTRVVLPLAMPGILAGAILVFVPCLGAYVSPELLGGGKSLMIGNLVQAQFGASRNWPFGAALALVLVAVLLLTLLLWRFVQRRLGRTA
ncbi:MAG: ABC transporter permease [Rhodoferax sp.]|uniref:ABC transporter permease n=1 Tax=Rhodoferax sp. TaxID=50421 RepID=UPI002619CB2F|nr:ABC transporter permease [Rhodoferax sp.]MDD5336761.1 ABC transporter permease [Rhodoferax sp.]